MSSLTRTIVRLVLAHNVIVQLSTSENGLEIFPERSSG